MRRKLTKVIAIGLLMSLTLTKLVVFANNYEDMADSVLIAGGKKYYLDIDGKLLNTNTELPDGYHLDEQGRLIDDNEYATEVTLPENIDLNDSYLYPLRGLREEFHLTEEYINYTHADFNILSEEYTKWHFYNNILTWGSESSNWVYVYLLSGEKPTGNIKTLGSPFRNSDVEDTVKIIRDFLSSFDWKNASDYEKVYKIMELCCKATYDDDSANGTTLREWLAENCTVTEDGGYTLNDPNMLFTDNPHTRSHHMVGCLVDQLCVCQGYAETFTTLCRFVNLESFVVVDVDSIHAWSYVKIDGTWYTVDLTSSSAAYAAATWLSKPAMEQEDVGTRNYNLANLLNDAYGHNPDMVAKIWQMIE